MLETLTQELSEVGLDLNAKNTKLFTTDVPVSRSETPCLVEVSGEFVEVVQRDKVHKYLGIALPGDLQQRGHAMVSHRIRCAWAKYHTFKPYLVDKHVDVALRFKLFDSVVTPSAMYGLSSAPLTQKHIHSLSVAQRKMLRNIVGHVKIQHEDWADYHRRMNHRIAQALQRQPMSEWAEQVMGRKEKLHEKIEVGRTSDIASRVCAWCPQSVSDAKLATLPKRGRGRPCTRWHEAFV